MPSTNVQPNVEPLSPLTRPDEEFSLDTVDGANSCVVHVAGDLDCATRTRMFLACTGGDHAATVIDLSRLTFMDCCGYGGIVAARNLVEASGRTLEIHGEVGQPARLLLLIAQLERDRRRDKSFGPTVALL